MNRAFWVKTVVVIGALATVATSEAGFELSSEAFVDFDRPDVVHFTAEINKAAALEADSVAIEVVVEDRFAVNSGLDHVIIPDDPDASVVVGDGISYVSVVICEVPPCEYGFSVDVSGSGNATVTATVVANRYGSDFSDDARVDVRFD